MVQMSLFRTLVQNMHIGNQQKTSSHDVDVIKIQLQVLLWKAEYVDALFFLVQVELLSGGVNMPVTPLNVYEYVRKYAEHRMLVVAEQPLHVSTTLG